MSLGIGRTKLHNAMEALNAHWDENEKHWKDPVRQDFEENYWAPLEPQVRSTLRAMDRMDQVLSQLRHECG